MRVASSDIVSADYKAGIEGESRLSQIPSSLVVTHPRTAPSGNQIKYNNDPCWFLENVSLRTATEIVALIGIVMRFFLSQGS